MIKSLIWLLILGIIGFFVCTQYLAPLSEEEKDVKQLEYEFNSAVGQFVRAGRISAGTGLATTRDAHDAIRIIKKIKAELMSLK